MIYKEGEIPLDINARRSAPISTNIQFFTQDTGSAKLSFSFTKDGAPLPLSAVDAKIVLLYADDSFYKRSLTLTDKVNGKAEYVLSDEELKHHGQVRAEVKLYYTNGQALATVFFTFSIAKTLEDQNIVPVAEYYIDDVESFRDQISQTLEDIKAKFDEFENIETKAGAQEKADAAESNAKSYTDAHAADKVKHITADERKGWNGKETPSGAQEKADKAETNAKAYTNNHAADTVKHITADERKAWNSKESTGGAQEKANKALSDAKAYTDSHAKNGSIHVTQSDKEKWNGAQLYKITGDNGKRAKLADGTDLLTLSTGFYYASGTQVKNNPAPNDASWFNYDVIETGMGRKTIFAWRSYDNTLWHSTIHTDGIFKGWKKVLTDADLSPTWNTVTLINGAKQDSNYPLKFSISNNVLWLRGSVGSLPAAGTVVAKFASKPTQVIDFLSPTIGSYGSARFAYTTDGELRFDGFVSVNDESKVTRVSIHEPIPLW
ncbi:phage baseplate upper protein [Bacillus sonorensis]|uniref:phage baseplate upper protein n=1 Tax=Bacillus sonorensis TaxID=119858 RepID=UPI002DB6EA78|nr:phage baseplate upper protein [Bacillus sonorensis]MEC1437430.1 phage baseplate upper protein [Bacillus sonorensis]